MRLVLGKDRLESDNEAVNQIRHVMERFEQRFTLNNPRLAERYVKAELHLLVYFVVHSANVELIVSFQREQSIGWANEQWQGRDRTNGVLGESLGHEPVHFCPNIHRVKCSTDGQQEAVFVDIVELVETPEGVIPTTIWISCVDS